MTLVDPASINKWSTWFYIDGVFGLGALGCLRLIRFVCFAHMHALSMIL
jgi:hypothetical protein